IDADLTCRQLSKTASHIQPETVSTLADAYARLNRLDSAPLDLALIDVRLPDGDGLSLLTHIRKQALPVAAVIITGTGDEDVAVAALKSGADDYVAKRKGYLERLPLTLESALQHHRAVRARQQQPLQVLYAEHDPAAIELTLRHFAAHAPHIHLEI